MQIVSSTEFANHYDKYLNMAESHDVRIKNGQKIFRIIYEPVVEEEIVFEPDEEFYNSISAEDFRKKAIEIVERVHHKFYGDERNICPKNA
jgi:hypothetical protein